LVTLRSSRCGTGWSKKVTEAKTMTIAPKRSNRENLRIRQQDFKTTLI